MPSSILAGSVAILAGSLCIYWASPNQRWLAAPWPARPARTAGLLLWAVGGWSLSRDLQPLTAVFYFFTALMLVLILLPYGGAFLHARRIR